LRPSEPAGQSPQRLRRRLSARRAAPRWARRTRSDERRVAATAPCHLGTPRPREGPRPRAADYL